MDTRALGAVLVVAAGLAAGGVAAADAGKTAPGISPAVAAPRSGSGPPKHYAVVNSGDLSAPAGTQSAGQVRCPAGTVPYGGGAFVSSGSLAASINTSVPTGTGWAADVNNGSGVATTFVVYAVCAKQPRRYQLSFTDALTNPAGQLSTGYASCPAHTVALGGGASSSTSSLSVNIEATIPSSTTNRDWFSVMNNASSHDATWRVVAVCGNKPKGYLHQIGAVTPNPAGAQTRAVVSCPPPTVPISGGGDTSAGAVLINLNSTNPISGGWAIYENNAEDFDESIKAEVVCAGT
jgi:hypothetical protein